MEEAAGREVQGQMWPQRPAVSRASLQPFWRRLHSWSPREAGSRPRITRTAEPLRLDEMGFTPRSAR